jgi:hypothetical protein
MEVCVLCLNLLTHPILAMHWSRFAATTHECSDQKTSAEIDTIDRSRSSSETSMWAACNKSSTRTAGVHVGVARNRTTTADAGVCGTEWNSVKYSKERVNVVHQFQHMHTVKLQRASQWGLVFSHHMLSTMCSR